MCPNIIPWILAKLLKNDSLSVLSLFPSLCWGLHRTYVIRLLIVREILVVIGMAIRSN
jgi:hypothetical protein